MKANKPMSMNQILRLDDHLIAAETRQARSRCKDEALATLIGRAFARQLSTDPERQAHIQAYARRAEILSRPDRVDAAVALGIPVEAAERLVYRQLRTSEALRAANALAKEAGHPSLRRMGAKVWLCLSGAVGCGKTTAASWWLLRGTNILSGTENPGGRRLISSEQVARLSLKYGPDRALWERIADTRLLVLDDVGVRDSAADNATPTDSVKALLDERYKSRRFTLITSNLLPEQLLAYFDGAQTDARMRDRWREVAIEKVVGDQSLRGRGAAG